MRIERLYRRLRVSQEPAPDDQAARIADLTRRVEALMGGLVASLQVLEPLTHTTSRRAANPGSPKPADSRSLASLDDALHTLMEVGVRLRALAHDLMQDVHRLLAPDLEGWAPPDQADALTIDKLLREISTLVLALQRYDVCVNTLRRTLPPTASPGAAHEGKELDALRRDRRSGC